VLPENEAHLARLKSEFSLDLDAKYRAGQIEHGGNMWEKQGMLAHAIEEAIDMVVYLYTLRDQLRERNISI
jgi:hypothetical protein